MLRSLRLVSVLAGAGAAGCAGFAAAHHSQAGIFDSRQTIEVTGVIKSISWRNPHGQILLDVTNADGTPRRMGRRDGVDRGHAQPRRGAERRRRRRSRDDRGRAVRARPQRDPRAQHAAVERLRVHVRRRAGALPRRQERPHRRPRDDRSRRRRSDGESRRHFPRLVDEHERPRRVPDVQRRVSADGRGPRRARAMEPARQLAAEVRHERHAADHDLAAADGVRARRRHDRAAARGIRHRAHDPHESERRGAGRAHAVRVLARPLRGQHARRRDRPHRGRATSITKARR